MKYSFTQCVSVAILCCVPVVANSLTYFDCTNSDGSIAYRIEPCLPGQIEKRHFQADVEKFDNSNKESVGYVPPRPESHDHKGNEQHLAASTTSAKAATNTSAVPNAELIRTPNTKVSESSQQSSNPNSISVGGNDDCFPEKYFSKDLKGIEIEWRRMSLKGYTCVSMLKSQDQIVNPADGFVALYISTNYSWRNFAYLHRKDNQFTLLPLNYSPTDPDNIYISQDIGTLASRYDAMQERYFLYVPGVYFSAQSWDKSLPNWEHFDGWWLDTKREQIEHVVLPAGPWVADANLDKLFLRAFRNFSCGVECYRHYDIKVDGGSIFVSISGTPAAIHENVTGTFKLRSGSMSWEKIKE